MSTGKICIIIMIFSAGSLFATGGNNGQNGDGASGTDPMQKKSGEISGNGTQTRLRDGSGLGSLEQRKQQNRTGRLSPGVKSSRKCINECVILTKKIRELSVTTKKQAVTEDQIIQLQSVMSELENTHNALIEELSDTGNTTFSNKLKNIAELKSQLSVSINQMKINSEIPSDKVTWEKMKDMEKYSEELTRHYRAIEWELQSGDN